MYFFYFSVSLLSLSLPSLHHKNFRKNVPVGTKLEPDDHIDPLAQTDGSPKSHPLSGWRANKNSAFPDEMEVKNLLQKLSSHSLEMHHTTGPGDTDSLSSYTSGW